MSYFFTVLTIAFTLFLLMDPIGNVPLFIAILKNFSPEKQRKIIRRELLIALGIILCFSFLGDWILGAIQVEQPTILIAGGIILFMISIRMIFSSDLHTKEEKYNSPVKEPLIVPLALPLVAGPAVLASVMLYAKEEGYMVTASAIVLAWVVTIAILLSSTLIKRILKDAGIAACEKLMGFLLVLMAVQMFLEGLTHTFGCLIRPA